MNRNEITNTVHKEYGESPSKTSFFEEPDSDDQALTSFFPQRNRSHQQALKAMSRNYNVDPKNAKSFNLKRYPDLEKVADAIRKRWDILIQVQIKAIHEKRISNRIREKPDETEIHAWWDEDIAVAHGGKKLEPWQYDGIPRRSLFDTVFIPTAFHIAGNNPVRFQEALEIIMNCWWKLVAPNRYGSTCVSARKDIEVKFFAVEGGEDCANGESAIGQFVYFYEKYGPSIAYLVATFQGQEQDRYYDGHDWTWSTPKLERFLHPLRKKGHKKDPMKKAVIGNFVERILEQGNHSNIPRVTHAFGKLLSESGAIAENFEVDIREVESAALDIALANGRQLLYDGRIVEPYNEGEREIYKPERAITPFAWSMEMTASLAQRSLESYIVFWEQLAENNRIGITANIGDTDTVRQYAQAEQYLGSACEISILRRIFQMPTAELAQLAAHHIALINRARQFSEEDTIYERYKKDIQNILEIAEVIDQKSEYAEEPLMASPKESTAVKIREITSNFALCALAFRSTAATYIFSDLRSILLQIYCPNASGTKGKVNEEAAYIEAYIDAFIKNVVDLNKAYEVIRAEGTSMDSFKTAISTIQILLSSLRRMKICNTINETEAPEGQRISEVHGMALNYADDFEELFSSRVGLALFRFSIIEPEHRPSEFLSSTNPYSQMAVLAGAFLRAVNESGKDKRLLLLSSSTGNDNPGRNSTEGPAKEYSNIIALASELRQKVAANIPIIENRIVAARRKSAGLLCTGHKIHTDAVIDPTAFSDLRAMFGLGSGGFFLSKMGQSLVGNVAPSSLEHEYIVAMLELMGIVRGQRPHLQTTLAGRLPAESEEIRLLGPLLILCTNTLDRFAPGAFGTSHDTMTDNCIMVYDDGVRHRGYGFDRQHMEGRTDKLGGASLQDFGLHQLLGTVLHDTALGGPTAEVGKKFLIPEATALLRKYDGLYGIERARFRAKWIHDPDVYPLNLGDNTSINALSPSDPPLLTQHEAMVNVYVNAWHDSVAGGSNLWQEAQQLVADTRYMVTPVLERLAQQYPEELDKHMRS